MPFKICSNSDRKEKKVKWCIYMAPFPYEDAQRRFTTISLPSAKRKHFQAPMAAAFKAVHVCWYSFYRLRKDGKLSEL